MQKLNHPNKLSMKSFISKFPFNSATTQLVGNDQSPKQKLINNLYNGVKHDKSGKITHDGKTILFTN